ncbi:unnamed protein product [Mytilus edulis]|uniref:Uncharacterized protein n=1 Tax=Mytilus edulis TaxID=6550 RepID=A0A8S3UHN4_MYTED|nr:unnamed protein product [Mytilus edulis]
MEILDLKDNQIERSEDAYYNRNLNDYTGHPEEFYDAPYQTNSPDFDDGHYRNSDRNFNQGNNSRNERSSRYDMEQNYPENFIRSTNASSDYDHRHHNSNDFQSKQRNETRENRHSAQYPKHFETRENRHLAQYPKHSNPCRIGITSQVKQTIINQIRAEHLKTSVTLIEIVEA